MSSRRPSRRPSSRRAGPKKKTPWLAYGLGALTVGLLVRGLYRPSRALVDAGEVTVCPGGDGCSKLVAVKLNAPSPVYALGAGKVIHSESAPPATPGGDKAHALSNTVVAIALSGEPIVIVITTDGRTTTPPPGGSEVSIGQPLFEAQPGQVVSLQVSQVVPGSAGAPAAMRAIDPLAWLVARGRSLTRSGNPASGCGLDGRTYRPPAPAQECSDVLALPTASPYLILPVTIQQTPAKGA
jgi:hypothetical protein